MAERSSDDIKQLFGHLGLDPRSYREIRDAKAPDDADSANRKDWTLLRAVNSQLSEGAPKAEAAKPETPTEAAPPPPPAAAPAEAVPALPATPYAMPQEYIAPAAPAPEAPTSEDDLAREMLKQLRDCELEATEPTPEPVPERESEPAPEVAPAAAFAAPDLPPPVRPATLPTALPETVEAAAPAEAPPAFESPPPPPPAPAPLPEGAHELVSTFRRLEAPVPAANPERSRLRLHYAVRPEAQGLAPPRDAKLDEVFDRLQRVAHDR